MATHDDQTLSYVSHSLWSTNRANIYIVVNTVIDQSLWSDRANRANISTVVNSDDRSVTMVNRQTNISTVVN